MADQTESFPMEPMNNTDYLCDDEIDIADLAEWLDNINDEDLDATGSEEMFMSCSSEVHSPPLPNNTINYNTSTSIGMNLHTDSLQVQQYQMAMRNLELSMRNTALSRREVMTFRHSLSMKPDTQSSSLERVNDFVCGKRKSLTTELEESRKRLKEYMLMNATNCTPSHNALMA